MPRASLKDLNPESPVYDSRKINVARLLAYPRILPPWLALIVHLSAGLPWTGFAALTYGAIIERGRGDAGSEAEGGDQTQTRHGSSILSGAIH